MTLSWSLRETPLRVEGVTATGAAAAALARKLLKRDVSALSGVRWGDRLVLLGPADCLPWCDGALYLGRLDQLYLPTLLQPSLPVSWLCAALRRHCPGPWALLPDNAGIGLSRASALAPQLLEDFLVHAPS